MGDIDSDWPKYTLCCLLSSSRCYVKTTLMLGLPLSFLQHIYLRPFIVLKGRTTLFHNEILRLIFKGIFALNKLLQPKPKKAVFSTKINSEKPRNIEGYMKSRTAVYMSKKGLYFTDKHRVKYYILSLNIIHPPAYVQRDKQSNRSPCISGAEEGALSSHCPLSN